MDGGGPVVVVVAVGESVRVGVRVGVGPTVSRLVVDDEVAFPVPLPGAGGKPSRTGGSSSPPPPRPNVLPSMHPGRLTAKAVRLTATRPNRIAIPSASPQKRGAARAGML